MKIINKISKNKSIISQLLLGGLLSLSLCHIQSVQAENQEKDQSFSEKIIGGVTSKQGDWQWMVALLKSGEQSNFDRQFCGGTLIAPRWVLTAAHCADAYTDISVLLGQNDLLSDSGGEIIPVTKIIIHPDFKGGVSEADIALLFLAKPSSIEPVSLGDNFDFQAELGQSAFALGWGVTYQGFFNDYYASDLQQVELFIETNSRCDSKINPEFDNVICLGISDEKATCNGDSGGPLLMIDAHTRSWKQVGISSFGTADCTYNGGIEVYTQVDKYKQFIDSTINSTSVDPEELLAKCANKYPDYVGQMSGSSFSCDNGLRICQNTTGGSFANITQLSVLRDNKSELLEYFIEDGENNQRNTISISDLGYCE